MYAPVAMRFVSYGVALDEHAQSYVSALLERPSMARWSRDAHDEPWSIDEYEAM